MTQKTWTMSSLLMVGVLGFAAVGLHRSPVEAATLGHTVKVIRGTVTRTEPLAGVIMSTSEASVSYSGRQTTVSSVAVQVGQSVTSGQTLATMANGIVLTAPFCGKVVQLNLNAGNVVPSASSSGSSSAASPGTGQFAGTGRSALPAPAGGQSVVSFSDSSLSIAIANPRDVTVSAFVSELDAHWFTAGQPATFIIPGEPGYTYSGQVQAVNQNPVTSGAAVTYPITLSLKIPKGAPTPFLGMSVQVFVPVARATGLIVPITAIHITSSGNDYVVAKGHNIPVTLGLIGIHNAIITKGLTADETVNAPLPAAQQPVTVQTFSFPTP